MAASNKKYKSLFQLVRNMCDNVPDLIWAKDINDNYTFANKAMCEILLQACDTAEPVGKNDLFFAKRERQKFPGAKEYHTFGEICNNTDQIVKQSLVPQRFDEYGNIKGEFLFLDVYKAPFLNEKGELIGTVGCARVVTEDKKIEKERDHALDALKKSENRYKSFIEAANDAIAVYDVNQNRLISNKAFFTFIGYQPQELKNKQEFELLHLHDKDKYKKAVLETKGKGYAKF
ncbi:MAG: PAS domain S-box protein [Bacteroidales bacterium]|nr:PAS domain S-box protein [Bacteroidales bacterium]